MRPWHLGNTTVRSPFRLREGLVALSTSSIQGNLRGRDQEIALRNLLGEHGIVELGDDVSYSVEAGNGAPHLTSSGFCTLRFRLAPALPRATLAPWIPSRRMVGG